MEYPKMVSSLSRAIKRSRGFTLIELLVTVAMVAILSALAAPSFNELRINQKLASRGSDLFSSILQARNEAMRLNRQVTVAPIASKDWNSGWQVFVDMNANSSFDSTADTLVVTTAATPEAFTATGKDGGVAPESFSFDSRGFLLGGQFNRVIIKSTVTGREKHVIVSSIGRARLCDPSASATCASGN